MEDNYLLLISLTTFSVIVFFSLCLSFNNIEAKGNEIVNLTCPMLLLPSDSNEFREANSANVLSRWNYDLAAFKHITYFGKLQSTDLVDYISDRNNNELNQSQFYKTNNETANARWYLQEKRSCSDVNLFDLDYLKRSGIHVIDFRDSRLGQFSPKGAPAQQCLACNACIEAYLLVLVDDEPSTSRLQSLGFKHIDNIETYIDTIKYGRAQ
jgi:hypothetical protein